MIKTLKKLSFKKHLIISFVIRLALIAYGEIHDQTAEVSYTDVDYKVVTDGARYILNNESPFNRHTYRYSPLLALILVPNLILFDSFGKIIFAIFDILVGILIKKIVFNELKAIFYENAEAMNLAYQRNFVTKHKITNSKDKLSNTKPKFFLPERYDNWSTWSALVWLYNPLTMVISTRGNGDSFSSFFVLLTLFYLEKYGTSNIDIFLAGIFHGLSIHLRIYPIVFSLAYYFILSNYKFSDIKNIRYKLFIPNFKQFLLIIGTGLGFFAFTIIFTYLYGKTFLYETYLYHFKRRDVRHNFSLYFLMQYLTPNIPHNLETTIKINLLLPGLEKAFIIMPQLAIFIYLSCTFGINRKTLSFCIFLETFVMVTYNTVVTSQYFVWYLALFPICLKNLRNMPIKLAVLYFSAWLLAQALWLLPAYLLEFKTLNTFNFIGIQGIAFFFLNIFIIQRFIKYYDILSKFRSI